MAERLGCTVPQLAVAWCLKNESVQCLLLGATSPAQLYESIQSLQVSSLPVQLPTPARCVLIWITVWQLVPKLNATTMTDLERILDNKPTRPPIVSTLALR